LSGDFIVGFPGETEADFSATQELVDAVGYAQAFSFAYSPRPGTPAAARDDLPREVKAERLQRLQAQLGAQQAAFQVSMVGRVLPVLVEKAGRNAGQVAGKSPYLQAVHFDGGEDLLGQVVPVEITASGPNSLAGRRAA
jgi:tRNA-2-methylthio-N6-dimethylallyladenosine synthase